MTCRYLDCTNEVAAPGMSRCALHPFSWAPGKPVKKAVPEWIRRKNDRGLPAKDLTWRGMA